MRRDAVLFAGDHSCHHGGMQATGAGDPTVRAYERLPAGLYLLIGAGLVALQALVLIGLGHPVICTCGTVKLWEGVVTSPENSQHLMDWYSFSHVIHGFIFYMVLWLIAPRMPISKRLAIAIGMECAWEIVENTPFLMERYRQTALAQGYFGDSVINSVMDTLFMILGFGLARLLPVRITAGLAVAMELFVGAMIHDNLTLNIIQLIHPFEAISRWQAGG